MLILGANTATSVSQIALIQGKKILTENSWESKQNESEKLVPEIVKLLKKSDKKLKEINKLVVIQGPGPFTALRVSITVINALAYALNIPVIGIPLRDYWRRRFEGEFVIYAGQNKVSFNNELIEFDDFFHAIKPDSQISGNLKEEQIERLKSKNIKWIPENELPSLGEVLLKLAESNYKEYKEKQLIEPKYFTAPVITKSQKAYK